MQTEKSKKSKYLFEVELEEDEVDALVHLDPDILRKLFYRCGKTFQKQVLSGNAATLFLGNYKMVMELHSSVVGNNLSVNLCLHFAILYSQFLLLNNREGQAKAILKETQSYAQIEDVDAMLMGACLNNLTYLYARQGKIYRALAVAIKGVNVIQWHLQDLKQRKQKSQMVDDVVVFVNLLMLSQTVIKKILKVSSKSFFKSLFKNINRLGYSFANKYLGHDSIFSKNFFVPEDSLLLPVYQEQEEQEKDKELIQFEVRIANELDNIYTALRELNVEPEIYYIKEHAVEIQSSKTEEIKITQQIAQQYSIFYTEEVEIDGWASQISFYRQQTNLTATCFDFQYLGNIQLKMKKGSKVFTQKIVQENFSKILECVNVSDVVPYEYSIKNMAPDQFFKKILINFITISVQGKVSILPRAISIINPIQQRFGGQTVYIFVSHIYFRKFRVAICQKDSSDTIYLDIYFKNKEIYEDIELTQIQNVAISKLRQKHQCSHNDYDGHLTYGKFKKLQMLNSVRFKAKIYSIVEYFQDFLFDDDANIMEQLNSTNIEECQKYYNYIEEQQNKGLFVQLRYRQNANYIQVYGRNSFETYTPEGLEKAKGNMIITPQQFLRDFGVGLKYSRKWMPAFFKLIILKYTLKVYKQPLDQMQEDRFEQNAMQELPLTSKFFRRKFLQFQDYMLPLTIELISVGLEKPLGLRVTAYEPIKSLHVGLFIFVNFDYWQKVYEHEGEVQFAEVDEVIAFRRYQFQKQYFLTKWLVDEGFQKIYSRLKITNRQLELKGISGKFCRLEDLL